MDYEGCCGDGAPPPEMVADAKETVSLRAENARLQAHIKVLDERGMQASLYVRLCYERDALQAKVEEAESHGCQDCAHEAGVPVSGPTGLCPKHADEQIDGHHSERRRRVKAEALAERRKKAWERVDLAVRTGVDPATANGPPENAAFFSKDELIAYIGLEARAAIEEEAHPG
ncbi:hypothetical protein LCGC14_1716120 [marine sediment metagenome]|uniref:Uncharacterized protein n=1 Tax=marine sediment metagenome TaxID=412755 RepID=A0A0F9JU69_9ZZZZ